MTENGYYSQEVHGPYELHDIGDLVLEEGGTIRGCKLAYATHGRLNAAKDNAILVPTWYSGTNKIIEQVLIGKGRALDNIFTERLWRSLKYEDIYLKDYRTPREAREGIDRYFAFYNSERPHQALDNRRPAELYRP